ncbi:MAG: 3-isopropylmalate dehydratase large subunit [Flavobacteriia bacterium]|nr:3-isopropylmalate dehydratase large subunit [Flavobacteriia bacterium]
MKTLVEKIWDNHVVKMLDEKEAVIYIDRHYIHEVTSPQAFDMLKEKGLQVFRPKKTTATVDHNIPTLKQELPIEEKESLKQVEQLRQNCKDFGIELQDLGSKHQGIVHVIGPEMGLTIPGSTIVCGDSHTSTHGAFGTIAFGIGTSEVATVFASQCVIQSKPLTMKIEINGEIGKYVTPKDVVLQVIAKIGTAGATGYFIEFSGNVIQEMSMEGRMTVCNMSIEMGARGGLIAPDEITFSYLEQTDYWKNRVADFQLQKENWKLLKSDQNAEFDRFVTIDATEIQQLMTYGTNPGTGIPIGSLIPNQDGGIDYMQFKQNESMVGIPVDYVFLGSCTNGRIEDLRQFASIVKGKQKAENVTAWIVPGSKQVEEQCRIEGIDIILKNAGFELRQPGCSACLAMNPDKVPTGKLCVSTSNRNFEGRQGKGSRTILASPITAAMCAVAGEIVSYKEFELL